MYISHPHAALPNTIPQQSNPIQLSPSLPSILSTLCLSPSHSKTLPKHTNARIRNSNKPARSMFLMPHILLLSPSRHKKDKESIINAHKKLSEEQDVMNDFVAKKSASSSSKIIHSFIQVFYSESKKRTSRIQKKCEPREGREKMLCTGAAKRGLPRPMGGNKCRDIQRAPYMLKKRVGK
jgi:hypothetical protein